MSNEWLNNCGDIRVSLDGKKLYIKIKKDFSVKEGDVIHLQKKQDQLESLVSAGILSKEDADEEFEKTKFIKYIMTKPPRQK